jgi:hydrogenase-4 membrane subunit HyfE
VIDLALTVSLLLSIALLCVRRIDASTPICAAQALFAAIVLGHRLAVPAVLAVALNGVAMPLAVARMAGPAPLRQRGSGMLAWAAVVATLVAALALFGGVGTQRLTAGVAVVLLGLLLIALRSHATAAALGLLSSQNGLVLVAGVIPGLAPSAAFAVAMPVAPALALAAPWLRR